MPISERDRTIQRAVCRGCRNDRYNGLGRKDDCGPVLSEKCKLLVYVKHDRAEHRYVCPYRVQ